MSLKVRSGRPVTIHNNLGGTGPWFDTPRVMRFAAITWVKLVVQTDELAAAFQQFFPGTQRGSEVALGIDLEVSNRSVYVPGGVGTNGGSAGGFATIRLVAGTNVTLRQRLVPSCCVDPECHRYRCGEGQICEGEAKRSTTYACRTDGMNNLSRLIPGLEFVSTILDADRATLGLPQEFTLAGYRQRKAVVTELPLGSFPANDSAAPHSANIQEDVLKLPKGFASHVPLYRGTFRAPRTGALSVHLSVQCPAAPPSAIMLGSSRSPFTAESGACFPQGSKRTRQSGASRFRGQWTRSSSRPRT